MQRSCAAPSAGWWRLRGTKDRAGHDPRFEDSHMRGSLTDSDVLEIPEQFRGLWAKSETACRGDGVRLDIGQHRVGEADVMRVQGYSDDPTAAMIDIGHRDRRGYLFVEISLGGKLLRVKQRAERQPFGEGEIFRLCFADRESGRLAAP
jgi:hypothetical protein